MLLRKIEGKKVKNVENNVKRTREYPHEDDRIRKTILQSKE